MKILSSIVVASIVTAVSALAFADAVPQAGETHAPLSEAHTAGTLARYVVSPEGHVRGFLLKDGTLVHVRPSVGDKMAGEVALGQTVRVDGRAAASEPKVLVKATVFGPHGQVSAAPEAPRVPRDKEARMEARKERAEALAKLPAASADGTVETVLTGRRGKPYALILSNGSDVFLEPSLRRTLGTRPIKAGDVIRASGKGGSYKSGTSLEASELTLADGTHVAGKAL